MQRQQVGVVGLVVGVGRLAELLGGEGVDDAGLEAGGGEGPLHDAVVAAGALDGGDQVPQVVLGSRGADGGDGVVEGGAGVVEEGGRHQHLAEEVGEHPLGAVLGAIDADDAEVIGADLLDTGVERPFGLVDRSGTAGAETFAAAGT